MALTITTNFDKVEEDCLTHLIVTLADDNRTPGCRYSLMIVFHSTEDAGGDVNQRTFPVIPSIPHQFWVKPRGAGGLTVWGFKECPAGPNAHSVLDGLDDATRELHREAIQRIASADPNWVLGDIVMLGIEVQECDTFNAASVGVGAATGTAGALATLLVALQISGTTAAGGAAAAGTGGSLAAIIGTAGTLSWTGVGLVILVGVVIGVLVWWWFSPDCCELGVEESEKGVQGSVFHG